MILSAALTVVMVSFAVTEISLAVVKRATRVPTAGIDDSGSTWWLRVAGVSGVGLAIAVQSWQLAPMSMPVLPLRLLALALMVAGVGIRWAAVVTLGRFFTVEIAVQAAHPVIRAGPYRFVRHPSYTGLLLAFAGFGFYLADWFSLVMLLVPNAAAVMNRIVKEEAVLRASLGSPYTAYCAQTKRLIPGVL
jgi:protein-S-isoprenylcysteine O-methyltransferase Ste14